MKAAQNAASASRAAAEAMLSGKASRWFQFAKLEQKLQIWNKYWLEQDQLKHLRIILKDLVLFSDVLCCVVLCELVVMKEDSNAKGESSFAVVPVGASACSPA